jgi:F0F1-type ATP synthase membrane subunit c/vacuolar-type H+-ATPase subunit K
LERSLKHLSERFARGRSVGGALEKRLAGLAGTGIGIRVGLVFAALLIGIARNSALRGQLFS